MGRCRGAQTLYVMRPDGGRCVCTSLGVPVEWSVTNSPCTVRRPSGVPAFRRSGDGVSSVDSGAGENVVKWCLVRRRVVQKSPVDVQHAQETAELTGCLGSLAVL
jgi:hypothetical protein